MSTSTTRSRLQQKKNQRRKARKKRAQRNLFILLCIAVVTVASVLGIRGGLRLSRQVKYPVQYSGYIVRYARENELDPYLVIAVIKQESNFVADARSPYAGGLMQLTEETAMEYAEKMGLEYYNYMDPETNIRIGCFVLRNLIDRYGVVNTALAAYNAGAGNVDKWLSDPGCSADGMTLTYIPFTETRNYVDKINYYMEEYRNNAEL
ncbi:MAG: lytic transglycosylase domain-containing protein [Candidatus Ornithomonoglobus sp.]